MFKLTIIVIVLAIAFIFVMSMYDIENDSSMHAHTQECVSECEFID